MSQIIAYKNTPINIFLAEEYPDEGWMFENEVAIHSGCNAGYAVLAGLPIVVGKSYIVTYEIFDFVSGTVRAEIGTTIGLTRAGNGEFTETILAQGNTDFRFYASGSLKIRVLKIEIPATEEYSDFVTISFNYKDKYWQGWWSYAPDMMASLGSQFFSWKNGALWKHNSNDLHNNFYSVQYKSIVRFVHNFEKEKSKHYWTIKIDSNGRWGIPEITTSSDELFPNGMRSRITPGNFEQDNGKYWADFFRDLNDPNFYTDVEEDKPTAELEALFEGRVLQGCTMSIEIQNSDTKEVKLTGIYIYTSDAERNF